VLGYDNLTLWSNLRLPEGKFDCGDLLITEDRDNNDFSEMSLNISHTARCHEPGDNDLIL
jgi:hypothetical protein